MIAARIERRGEPPRPTELPQPQAPPGHALLRVHAAGLNPVDLAVAGGRFYLAVPEPPYVPGAEAVGEVIAAAGLPPGARAWGLCLTGAFAEVVAVPEERLVPVPDGVPDEAAIVAGIAGLAGWMAVRERGALAPGERVVVLGAGGVVGQVAIQAARAGGAGAVVGVARSPGGRDRAVGAGADAALEPSAPDLGAALRKAAGGAVDLVVDGLWGPAAAAAVGAMAPRARLVQVGNSMSPTAELPGGPLRGGRLDLRGFSVFSEAGEAVARSYAQLASALGAGTLAVPVASGGLGEAAELWRRQAAGAEGVKLVLRPPPG